MTQQLSWIHDDPLLTKKQVWHLYVDGAARGNPGPAGVGLYITRDTQAIVREGFFIGTGTNNQAEYTALLLGLCRLHMLINAQDHVHIYSDSQLLVRQIQNVYRVKNVILKKLHTRAHELLAKLHYSTHHIPRRENLIADSLANDGIDSTRLIPEDLQHECGINHIGIPCN